MDWVQLLVFMLGNLTIIIPMFLWCRSEARNDYRHTDAVIEAIRQDIKDFHGRLCSLEEKRKK